MSQAGSEGHIRSRAWMRLVDSSAVRTRGGGFICGEPGTTVVPVSRGEAAPSLAAVGLRSASPGPDAVTACLRRAARRDAGATRRAVLGLSRCRRRPVASPPKGSCVSPVSWAKRLEGRRLGWRGCRRPGSMTVRHPLCQLCCDCDPWSAVEERP